jgi:cell division protein ZapE
MTPLERYQAELARGAYCADAAQQSAVERLQLLYERLCLTLNRPWWSRWRPLARAVKGIYLWGAPGRGKTWLMDAFHDCLPMEVRRRVHFHRFMLEVHQALAELPKMANPLDRVAGQLAAQCQVLCIDEFHVVDVADAMLLAGLLDGLVRRGVALVITSNTAPEALYPYGLQRARFLPAIALLQAHCDSVEISGARDFRLEHLQHSGVYSILAGDVAYRWLASCLQELAGSGGQQGAVLQLSGRRFQALAMAEDIVWLDFETLCEQPASTRDYLQLAQEFHTLLLQDVPVMGEEADEAARRFIHLVDTLYDHNVKLVVTAAAGPAELYTGQRLQSAFGRTASRLSEMSSQAYLARPHR